MIIRSLYNFINRNWWQVFSMLIAIILCLLAVGCASPRAGGCVEDPDTPAAVLGSVGHTLVWAGSLALVLGIFVRVAFAVAFLNPVAAILSRIPGASGIATLCAEVGAVALVCGLGFIWLSDHLWLLVAACGVSGLAWAWHRRASLVRWYRSWTKPT